MTLNRILIIVSIILSVSITYAQEKSLVALDGVFINSDSAETVEKLGIENIDSIVKLPQDSAINILGELGKNGLVIIQSKNRDTEISKSLRENQYKPFDVEIKYIVDGEQKGPEYLETIDPHQIKSIKLLYPLEAVMEYGIEMINGIVIIKMK